MSEAGWFFVMLVLIVVLYLVAFRGWRPEPEPPPPHNPDSAGHKRGT